MDSPAFLGMKMDADRHEKFRIKNKETSLC